MKRTMIWALLSLALAAPAAVWAGSMAADCCPIPECCAGGCEGCPFGA